MGQRNCRSFPDGWNSSIEGKELRSTGKEWTWHVSCIFSSDEGVITAEEESSFETAYHNREDWKGKFIGETKDHEYHLYRKKFGCKRR